VTVGEDAVAALILYVEDEVLIQDAVVSALHDAGYEVLAVTTSEEAIETLESRAAELRGMITDINLGSAMDGWEVARRAREVISGLPVVYISGASHHDWTFYMGGHRPRVCAASP
jgi:CheY-like chemotaxis protein